MDDIAKLIRTIPDYPKKGIMFRDITTLLKDSTGFKKTIDTFFFRYQKEKIDYVAGIEARGFILGSALAYALHSGFIPIRKKGKLPGNTLTQNYELEYGSDTIEMHKDAIFPGAKILLVDDLIATGGTAMAAISLIKKASGLIFETAFVVDLPELGGSSKIESLGHKVFSLCSFPGH